MAAVKDWALRGGHSELAKRLESALSSAETPTTTHSSGIDFAEDVSWM